MCDGGDGGESCLLWWLCVELFVGFFVLLGRVGGVWYYDLDIIVGNFEYGLGVF